MTTQSRTPMPRRLKMAFLVICMAVVSVSAFPASSNALPIYIDPGPIFNYCSIIGGCPSFTAHPTSPTSSTTADFSASFSDHGLYAFMCKLDGGAEFYCAGGGGGNLAALFGYPVNAGTSVPLGPSPTGLAEGSHTFTIRGRNAISQCHTELLGSCIVPGYAPGATYTSSSSYTWIVDHTAPVALFTSGPTNGSTITTSSAEFGFATSGVDLTPVTFTCSKDGGSFASCTTPLQLTNLSGGSHSVAIKPTDAAGNVGATVTRTFTAPVPPAAPAGAATVAPTGAAVKKHCIKRKKVKVKKHGKVVHTKAGKIKFKKKCVKYSS